MPKKKIDINPQDIEDVVAKAILDSAIGETIEGIIQEELDNLKDSWDESPLRKSIRLEIEKIVLIIVREEYRAVIKDAIQEKFSDGMVDKIVTKALLRLWEEDY